MDILIAVLLLMTYGALASVLVYLAIKKTRIFMILLGIAVILGAVPLGFIAEISIAGCCGAPSNGRQGVGYVLAVLVVIVGVLLIVMSRKFKKNMPQK